MKNNYLIVFLVLTVVVLGYFVLKGGNATTEEQNQTSAAATAKLQTYSNSNAITLQTVQKVPTVKQPPINYTFTKTLSSGMKSDEVTKLQQVLAENVYYEGEITGVMDKLTVQELKDFQTDNGLEVTGTTGPKTRTLLTNMSKRLGLCAGGNPAIRVRTPNGGEVFQEAQQTTIRWRTCNVPASANVRALLGYNNQASIVVTGPLNGWTVNDGQEIVGIPTMTWGPTLQVQPGLFYKLYMEFQSIQGVFDQSDNLFTINGHTACTPTTPPSIELLSPNGGEVYEAGQPVTLSWSTCNIPVSANLTANLYNNVTGQAITLSNNYLPFPNTGSVTLTLPASPDWVLANGTNMTYGTIYKFKIQSGAVNDFSDNLFTINAPQVGCAPNRLTATLGPWSPSSWYVSGTQSNVQFTQTKLTAAGCDIRLSSISFQRTGFSNNSWVTNLSLYNGATLIADGGQLNSSTGVVTFSGLNIPIPAGNFVLLDLKGDMTIAGPGHTGTIGFQISNATSIGGVNLQSQIANISGYFPIMSGQLQIVQ